MADPDDLALRLGLLEAAHARDLRDMEAQRDEIAELRAEVGKLKGVLMGFLVMLATASVMLAANMAVLGR